MVRNWFRLLWVWNMFCPSLGWVPINPDMEMEFKITGMTFPAARGEGAFFVDGDDISGNLGLKQKGEFKSLWASARNQSAWHDRHYGGMKPLTYFMTAGVNLKATGLNNKGGGEPSSFLGTFPAGIERNGRTSPIDINYRATDAAYEHKRYDFVTAPWIISDTLKMNSGNVEVKIYSGGTGGKSEWSAAQSAPQLVQTVKAQFSEFTLEGGGLPVLPSGRKAYINEEGNFAPNKTSPMEYWSLSWDGANPLVAGTGRLARVNGHQGGYFSDGDVVRSVGVRHGDTRLTAVLNIVEKEHFQEHRYYTDNGKRMAHDMSTTPGHRFAGSHLSSLPDNSGKGRKGKSGDGRLVPKDSGVIYNKAQFPATFPSGEALDDTIKQYYGDLTTAWGIPLMALTSTSRMKVIYIPWTSWWQAVRRRMIGIVTTGTSLISCGITFTSRFARVFLAQPDYLLAGPVRFALHGCPFYG